MSSLIERDSKCLWHPYTQPRLEDPALAIVRAEGSKLYLEDGREIIDAISSWWVNLHGHSHPAITAAIQSQLEKFHHVIFAGFTHEPAIRLAENLLKVLPASQSRLFYSDDGSTAVEVAIKIALQLWHNRGEPKRKVLALAGAYHGDTFGAMSVSARGEGSFAGPFDNFLFDVSYLPLPTDENQDQCIAALNNELESGAIAAFIFEPLLQGAGGMRIYSASLLSELIRSCKSHGVPTIADEVFTGFGRTGKLFASQYLSVEPDIFCLSKGITGGTLPLGATITTEGIYTEFLSEDKKKMLLHGHSYTANPLACSAGLASLDLLTAPECQGNISRITARNLEFVKRLKDNPKISNSRSLGTVLACDIESGGTSNYFQPLRERLYKEFLQHGVLLRPLGNVVYIVPPYCTCDDDLEEIVGTIESVASKI